MSRLSYFWIILFLLFSAVNTAYSSQKVSNDGTVAKRPDTRHRRTTTEASSSGVAQGSEEITLQDLSRESSQMSVSRQSPDQIQILTTKNILDNGLTVLISEMPSSSSVSIYTFVKTGSANEGEYLGAGLSHFLEHMLFKGTSKRTVGEIAGEIQALGGVINASTSFDYTIYTITVPAESFDQALDVASDMIMNSSFDPVEIDKERDVVFSEMKMHNDRPGYYLSNLIFRTVYSKHPYRIPIIGHESLLRQIKREDFLNYYRKYYIPNNIILSIAGNVKEKEILSKIREVYKNFEMKPFVERNILPEPEQISPRRYSEEYATDLTRMSLAYVGVSALNNDMYPMDLLMMILGRGESSRLYLEIFKKRKLVHSISTSNYTPIDKGIFEINCVLDKENIDETIKAVKEQIALIAKEGVSDVELNKTKQQVFSNYIFDHQTPQSVAYISALDEAFIGDYNFSKKYVHEMQKVTNGDIKRVAKKYLIETNLSTVLLLPKDDDENITIENEQQNAFDIKKVVLTNGLTLLLREDHTFPLVSINLALHGGTRQETIDKNGLSYLSSILWIKGTKSRNAEEIAEDVAAKGARLRPFSGKNSFGIRLNTLSKDFDFGINLLEDFIKEPTFPTEELGKEKEKVKAAIIARNDNISKLAMMALKETLFKNHPFRFEELGTLNSVENISREDIIEFYNRNMSSDKMVLSVYGDIDAAKIEKVLTEKFGSLEKKEFPEINIGKSVPEESIEKTIYLNKEQAVVLVGFHGVEMEHEDYYGVEILTSILGSSFSGRIFNKVREDFGQSYTLGGNSIPSRDVGMIYFYVATNKESVEKVKELLINIIKDVNTGGVTDEELKNIKSYLKGTFKMSIDTNASLCFRSSLDELYGIGYGNYMTYVDKIDKITKDDIKNLANKYLDLNKATIIIAIPEDKDS